MTPSDGRRRAASVALVEELRRLGSHVAAIDVEPDAAADLVRTLRSFREGGGPDRRRRWSERSPFQGELNVAAPPLLVRHHEEEGRSWVVGEVTLDERHGGPPGAVHGGVVAGLLDEVLGIVPRAVLDVPVVTGRLVVRYRTPTPLDRPLRVRGWLESERGRRVVVRGDCRADGRLTAEAEGLFIRVEQ